MCIMKLKALYNMDCMEAMEGFPDNFFDLAIVDPEYGINADRQHTEGHGWVNRESKGWDKKKPNKEYFIELMRVSKNQIIWGGNYFTNNLHESMGWIVWNKGQRNFSLADGELAWTSFDVALRIFDYSRGKHTSSKAGFHPTEKPVQLYKWLLRNYATSDMKIIDTHAGSCSSVIAFIDFGCEWIAFEKDKDYYEAATKRIEQHKAQLTLNL